jgi:ketosteroid isomerase-like protein
VAHDGDGADAVSVVLAFNEAINQRDLGALAELMTERHRFVDSESTAVEGKQACVEAWRGFFAGFPDYRNEFVDVVDAGDGVVVARGRSHCSFAALDGPAVWRAVVTDGRVDLWQVSEPS